MFQKHYVTLLSLFLSGLNILFSQTPQNVVTEHFTNTLCSICASKNPAFYSLLNGSYPQVLHIAYHPSAPYANCYFSLQNTSENNARTNYYGVFGSTPRAVIQGNVIPIKTPLIDPSDIDLHLNKFSPFALTITINEVAVDSFDVRLVVTATAAHSYSALNLYGAVTEDTVFYNAGNGEPVHFDVFRKQLFSGGNYTFTSPQTVGDSVIIQATYRNNSIVQKTRMSVIAMLQESTTKSIIQAEKESDYTSTFSPSALHDNYLESTLLIFPNPAVDNIQFTGAAIKNATFYSLSGNIAKQVSAHLPFISTADLENGVYIIKFLTTQDEVIYKRIVVVR